jgi:hypothetical protein
MRSEELIRSQEEQEPGSEKLGARNKQGIQQLGGTGTRNKRTGRRRRNRRQYQVA